jgi:hypothetical protein
MEWRLQMVNEKKPIKSMKYTHVRASSKRNLLNKVCNIDANELLNIDANELLILQKKVVERLNKIIIKLNNVSI